MWNTQEIDLRTGRRISTFGGRQCGRCNMQEVNWGREQWWCLGGEVAFPQGERKRRKRVRGGESACRVHTKRKPLWTMDCGSEGDCHRFWVNSVWSSNYEVLEVHNFQRSRVVACTPGEKEGTGPGAGYSPSWSTFRRGNTKDPIGTSKWSFMGTEAGAESGLPGHAFCCDIP